MSAVRLGDADDHLYWLTQQGYEPTILPVLPISPQLVLLVVTEDADQTVRTLYIADSVEALRELDCLTGATRRLYFTAATAAVMQRFPGLVIEDA